MYALHDGLIRKVREQPPKGGSFTIGTMTAVYELTPEGREFIRKWYSEDEEIA
jgi:DNA-binding PadR family transcriptional regulator